MYNVATQTMVAYDDPISFGLKVRIYYLGSILPLSYPLFLQGDFIATHGLKGFAMWEAGGDYNELLLDAIRLGAGFPELECDTNPK